MAITGTGWPSHAAVTHQYHENYARRTLYAYVRCPAFTGVDYIHAMVERYYDNSFAKALEHFVSEENHWCPPWVRRTYNQKNNQTDTKQNKEPATEPRKDSAKDKPEEDDGLADDPNGPDIPDTTAGDTETFPHRKAWDC